jgi:hypothetical protein
MGDLSLLGRTLRAHLLEVVLALASGSRVVVADIGGEILRFSIEATWLTQASMKERSCETMKHCSVVRPR